MGNTKHERDKTVEATTRSETDGDRAGSEIQPDRYSTDIRLARFLAERELAEQVALVVARSLLNTSVVRLARQWPST
jgi:hypothetical protein